MSARMRQALLEDADAYIGGAEKVASISGAIGKRVIKSTLERPGQKYFLATGIEREYKKGRREHRERMRALREGYPVGWVALGMKPHPGGR